MFPNNKTLSYPLYLIGLIMIVCGVRWLIHPEPWMLDEVANVERLGMTFDTLFGQEINNTLPDYLTQIYRFFGFWVLSTIFGDVTYLPQSMKIDVKNVFFV